MRVESLADIGIGGTSGRIQRAHATVADGGDKHREERDQNDGDEVAV